MAINESALPISKSTPTSRSSREGKGVSPLKSVKATAIIAAILYLVITVAAIVAHMAVQLWR